MTRIPYRRPEDMTERARELTAERGNLNVYRALANAENVFTGWMLAGRDALTSPVLPRRLRELVDPAHRLPDGLPPTSSASTETSRARPASAPTRSPPLTSESDWQSSLFRPTERAVCN